MYMCIHTHTHVQVWRELEAELFELNVPIPIYFALEDAELEEIHDNLAVSANREKNSTVAASVC